MSSTSSPPPTMELGHTGDAEPSYTSHTRLDVAVTAALNATLQHDSGIPSASRLGGASEGCSAIMSPDRPSSSSSTLGSSYQHAQTPQGLSHPSSPRQQSPQQEMHMSPVHLSERSSASTPDPNCPQSQPQRLSSNQRTGSSLTPNIPPGTLPANSMLLQGPSIGGGSCPPSQPGPSFCKAIGDGQLPLAPASSTENGDPSRQPGAPGIPPSVPSHHPTIGHGQALMRILQFSGMLAAEDQKSHKLRLEHWVSLVEEFFLTSATLKLVLWRDNKKEEAKVFEIGKPVLPQFFLVTSQSGVKSMTLSLDGARERIVGPNRAIVHCVFAMWTYRYYNGYTVTLRGPFSADVFMIPDATQNAQSAPRRTPFKLMIDRIYFDSYLYEKRVSVDVIGGNRLDANKVPQVHNAPTPPPSVNGAGVLPLPPPQLPPPQADQRDEERREGPETTYDSAYIPVEPVNAFGIPQATMRCLELAEGVSQMTELMQYSYERGVGPLDTLRQFAQNIRVREMLRRPQGHQRNLKPSYLSLRELLSLYYPD